MNWNQNQNFMNLLMSLFGQQGNYCPPSPVLCPPAPCPTPTPTPAPCPTPTPTPTPTPVDPCYYGAVGINGDPRMGLYTAGLTVPNALKDFSATGLASNADGSAKAYNLLTDPSNGLSVTGNVYDHNGATAGGNALQSLQAAWGTNGANTLTFGANGQATASNGVTLTPFNRTGDTRQWYKANTGEYEISGAYNAAANGAGGYWDTNFQELGKNVAADATSGFTTMVKNAAGQDVAVNLAKLLMLDCDATSTQFLRQF